MYDSHTHLNEPKLFANRKDYLQKFIESGWKWLINSWASQEYNLNWIEITKNFKQTNDFFLKSTLWFHPLEIVYWDINEANISNEMDQIKKLYLENQEDIVAIWECWIDVHFDEWKTLNLQKKLFWLHCDLAQELNLPIIVHSRDELNETLDVLKNYKNLTIYFHCRSYWPQDIKFLQDNYPKLFVGFCGNITYKKSQNLLDSIKMLDISKLLLETDAPDLAPQEVRWTTNHPANVVYIYNFVAKYLNMDLQELSDQIEKNFLNLYNKITKD